MTPLFDTIFDGDIVRATYTLLMITLGTLVAVSLWRGRRIARSGVMKPFLGALASLIAGRLLFIGGADSLQFGSLNFVMFSALHFIGFQNLALSLDRLATTEPSEDDNASDRISFTGDSVMFSVLQSDPDGVMLLVRP